MNRHGFLKSTLMFVVIAMLILFSVPSGEKISPVSAANDAVKSASHHSKNDTSLKKQINQILKDSRLDGTSTGVSVRRAGDGKLLYSHKGDLRLHPASNMKILTAASALETLGPKYRFSTEVLADGRRHGPVLHGNVYLKGKGDPTLLKKDLDHMAKKLKKKGIRKIKGNLVGDGSRYDDVRLSQDLNWSDEPFYTGAQVSALTLSPNDDYDAGTIIVDVKPGKKAGVRPKVKLKPKTDYVKIVNHAHTVASGKSDTISVEREHGKNKIDIKGNIPLDANRSRSWSSVWEPTGYALDVFKKSLNHHGIRLIGNSKVKIGKTPDDAKKLVSKRSVPLKKLYIPFLKLSNNGHAEALVKEMGKVEGGEGSWDKGLPVMEKAVKKLGMDTSTIQIRDGSGMSHKDMVTTDGLSKFLYTIQDKSWFGAFKRSLPVAGMSERLVGGTLRSRMTEKPLKGNVVAKTGSISGVSTLSGYVTAADGTDLTFSIMINNYLDGPVTPIEDDIAKVLAKHKFK